MSADIPEPQLSPAERDAFDSGVAQFNAGLYFECHDTLEDLWAGIRGPTRDFFQALIQVAVAFHHLGNGNRVGAESMLDRALARFARYPERYFGFDLAAHRAELAQWRERVRADEWHDIEHVPRPQWCFALPPE
jgi:predicted metal-dependent hydrolase